jgi:hypothetical protein
MANVKRKKKAAAAGSSPFSGPEAVARLLVLLLAKLGTDSAEIGAVLGVDPSRVRQLIPMSKLKKLKI